MLGTIAPWRMCLLPTTTEIWQPTFRAKPRNGRKFHLKSRPQTSKTPHRSEIRREYNPQFRPKVEAREDPPLVRLRLCPSRQNKARVSCLGPAPKAKTLEREPRPNRTPLDPAITLWGGSRQPAFAGSQLKTGYLFRDVPAERRSSQASTTRFAMPDSATLPHARGSYAFLLPTSPSTFRTPS